MSKVLITGGAGFIGAHLAARLHALGHEVHLAESFTRGVRDREIDGFLERPNTRLFECDLTDPAGLDALPTDYSVIYHLAAVVGVAHVIRSPYRVLSANVAMLDNALAFAEKQADLRRFVFTSTSEVYSGTLKKQGLPFPTPESVDLVCHDLDDRRASYMLSKIYGEAMCHASGVPCTLIRPHNVYGPRMGLSHVIPELLARAHRAADGGKLEVYSVDHRRTFCYIDDAVEMLRLAAEAEGSVGRAYNLGNQEPEVTIGELAELVLNTVGRKLQIVPLPETVGSPPRRAPDTTEIRAVTGYESRVSLKEGVERTFAWYRDQGFAGADVSKS